MSDSSTAIRPSRAKVWLPFTASEPLGQPLAEWGYRTPRFPLGIKRSDLANQPQAIQRETMTVWFLANHAPPTGPFFGYGDGANSVPSSRTPNTTPADATPNGAHIAGWGQGRWFSGRRAVDLLTAEFAEIVPEQQIADVAALFDEWWELVTNESIADLTRQPSEQRTSTIVAALDEFADAVQKLAPEHGGIGHNGPPEDVPSITEDERRTILRATAATRIAVLSSDYSAAGLAWQNISPIIGKLGGAIAKQIEAFSTKFSATLGITTALIATGYIGDILGIWDKAEAISAMLELTKHLLH